MKRRRRGSRKEERKRRRKRQRRKRRRKMMMIVQFGRRNHLAAYGSKKDGSLCKEFLFSLKEDKNKMPLGEGPLLVEQTHSEPVCSFPVVGQNNESNCRAGCLALVFLAGKPDFNWRIMIHNWILKVKLRWLQEKGNRKACWKMTLRC